MGVLLAHMTIDFAGHPVPSHAGLRVALVVAGGAALVALALVAFIPGRRTTSLPAAVPAHSPTAEPDAVEAGV